MRKTQTKYNKSWFYRSTRFSLLILFFLINQHIVVANTPPTHDNPILTSALGTDTTNEDLTCTAQNTFDVNGDDVKNIYNWYNDTNPIQILNMPFEGGSSGSSTKDYSDFANNGTVNGATWNPTGGHDGKGAYEFDTSADYISVADHNSLDVINNFSISLWVKSDIPTTSGDWRVLIAKEHFTARTGWFLYENNSYLGFVSNSSHDFNIPTPLLDTAWHHLVLVVESGNSTLYSDGINITSAATNITANSENLYIGARHLNSGGGSADYWDGSIDDVQIFNRALSAEQILAIYQNRTVTTEDVIVSEETTPGDIWQSCITPNDGTEDGITKCSNPLVIDNSPPTHDNPILTSALGTDTTDEDLTSTPQNTFDANSTDVKNIYNWYKDTNPIQGLNMPFEGRNNGSSTKDYSDFANNGTVTGATLNPTGGFDGKGAYDFDGNDMIEIPYHASLNPDIFTVSLWARVDGGQGTYRSPITSRDTNPLRGYIIYAAPGNNWHFWMGTGSSWTIKQGPPYVLGEWTHVVISYDGTYIYLYIDGALHGSPKASAYSKNTVRPTRIGAGATENSGNYYFNGLIDDVQIFNRALSAEQILAIYQNRTVNTEDVIVSEETTVGDTWKSCVTPNDGTEDGMTKCSNELEIIDLFSIDHIEIYSDGTGLTCLDDSIIVKACADSGCSSVATTDVLVTLAATGGTTNWSSNPVTIPANSDSGVAVTLIHRTAETITLSANSVPAASNSLVCTPADCNITFSEAGFILTLPDHNSCTTAELKIEAVKLSETGTTCAPAYIGDQSVNFSFNYLNPANGTKLPTLDSSNMAAENVVQARDITFDSTASATLDFQYEDAGLLRITVADNAAAGLSSAYVDTIVIPPKLIVSTSDANNECTGDYGGCSAFKVAGEPANTASEFTLDVTATCNNENITTTNFQMNNITLSSNLVAPSIASGASVDGSNASLGESTIDITLNGTASVTQTISEVGVFSITATPDDYLGLTTPIAPATSANIGRFIPDRFVVTGNTPQFTDSTCNFTYQDQPFGFAAFSHPVITVKAVNSAGTTTQNYGGDGVANNDFWKLNSGLLTSRTYNNQVAAFPGSLTQNLDPVSISGANNYDGINTFSFEGDQLTYNKYGVVPITTSDAAFNANILLNLTAASLTDSDGVYNDSNDDGSIEAFISNNIIGTNIRWGRWYVDNAFGSELQPLVVVAEAQHFDGNHFVKNTDDNYDAATCPSSYTPLVTADVTLSNYIAPLATGNTALPATLPAISSGIIPLMLSAPGDGNDGSVMITITTPSWLTYDFNGDSSADDASATATFGIFKGREPVIIKRQNY